MKNMIQFTGKNGEFQIAHLVQQNEWNFPVANEEGIKSSVTQNFGGDCKLDQNHFLLEPVSIENLHNNRSTRNIWCTVDGKDHYSLTGASAQNEYERFLGKEDDMVLDAGFMWQEVKRIIKDVELEATVRIFAPLGYGAEVMQVKIVNKGKDARKISVTPAIPLYGRSADNLRDHRHVTSLLHRIKTSENGVICKPVLSFDERGHQKNNMIYYVAGSTENGENPVSFFPTVASFIGESGTFLAPEALAKNQKGCGAGKEFAGEEALGAMTFAEIMLAPGQAQEYIVVSGMTESEEEITRTAEAFHTKEQADAAFIKAKEYWNGLVNISFETGNPKEDSYLKWICFQPILRRIYGCSFLPYHDYGKGGRGWRDLWQDCLALLLMDPSAVRQMIIDNYGGVRVDGTNATIIGNAQGEFIADRNHITRVWMDHAFWPFVTTKFYIDQTGDLEILFEKVPYFKDQQSKRGTDHDTGWDETYGKCQRTEGGVVYFGSVLEHLLLQNLCAFYDVGAHNEMRLHGADWNDALDMAWENGESVAFTSAYAGNLKEIAHCIRLLEQETGCKRFEIAEEMGMLFAGGRELYENVEKKRGILDAYLEKCAHNLSGQTMIVKAEQICSNLEEKADWLMEHIRVQEWIAEDEAHGWFNGYYDDHKNPVEGCKDGKVRMMLTSQVFAIMSGTATPDQIRKICQSADKYLYDEKAGGYRLNTDFGEEKMDLGRMFGFAYGEKENGAVFSHMAVMYANALYRRGFAREGNKALQALLNAAMNFDNSRMYPGLPEYYDLSGRGMYAYLTGAASWYLLTMVTEVFGVKGVMGDLVIAPAFMPEQFDAQGNAEVKLIFAGKKFDIRFSNPEKCECKKEWIKSVLCDEKQLEPEAGAAYAVRIKKEWIKQLDAEKEHVIKILFGR